MEPIASFVEWNTGLTTLDLCSVLGFDNSIDCDELVWTDGMLCWLVWTDNRVGNGGMELLCEALTWNSTVTKLNVECLLWTVLSGIAQNG